MKIASVLFEGALVSGLLFTSFQASSSQICDTDQAVIFKQKDELPIGVLSTLGFEMSDINQPFQSTDIVNGYPLRRFVSAQKIGCGLTLNYQRGGRGYTRETASLKYVGGKWILLRER